MKDNTTAPEIARTNKEVFTREAKFEEIGLRATCFDKLIDNELPEARLQQANGGSLIRFCRELAVIITRRVAQEDNTQTMRVKLAASLVRELECAPVQAQGLIDLALEMIHSETHGCYSRTALELSYLMATATGVVFDAAAN